MPDLRGEVLRGSFSNFSSPRVAMKIFFHRRLLTKQCMVPLSMGKDYPFANFLCNNIDMESFHSLLGQPWQCDVRVGPLHKHVFVHMGRNKDQNHSLLCGSKAKDQQREEGANFKLLLPGS